MYSKEGYESLPDSLEVIQGMLDLYCSPGIYTSRKSDKRYYILKAYLDNSIALDSPEMLRIMIILRLIKFKIPL